MGLKSLSIPHGVQCILAACIPLVLLLGWDAYSYAQTPPESVCSVNDLPPGMVWHLLDTVWFLLTNLVVFFFGFLYRFVMIIYEYGFLLSPPFIGGVFIAGISIALFCALVVASFKKRRFVLGKILAVIAMVMWIFMAVIPPAPMC